MQEQVAPRLEWPPGVRTGECARGAENLKADAVTGGGRNESHESVNTVTYQAKKVSYIAHTVGYH